MATNYIVAIVFALFYLAFVVITRRTKTFSTFAIADKSVGLILIFASLSATFIGPAFTLSMVREGFESGFFYLAIAGIYGIQKILIGFLIAPRLRQKFVNAYSIGDVIGGEKSHDNKAVHIITGIISFGLMTGFSIVMSRAGGELLNNFLGVNKLTAIIVMTSIVIIYSFFGGIRASILTDAFQFFLFVVLIPMLLIFIFYRGEINFCSVYANIGKLSNEGFRETSGVAFFSLIITWFLGEALVPPTINRILASKDSSTSKKALLFSGLFLIVWLTIMLLIGVASRTTSLSYGADDQLLLNLARDFYPNGLYGIFVVAMIGVIMSTQDSLINSGAVIFTRDIIKVFNKTNQLNELKTSRFATVLIGLFSIVFAVYIPSILDGLLFFYTIWAPSILVTLIASIWLRKHSFYAAIVSMLSGIVTTIAWTVFNLDEILPTLLVGLGVSLLGYFVTHKLTIDLFLSKKTSNISDIHRI